MKEKALPLHTYAISLINLFFFLKLLGTWMMCFVFYFFPFSPFPLCSLLDLAIQLTVQLSPERGRGLSHSIKVCIWAS